MKPLFIRIDDELDQRLSELCRREGYKKGGVISKLIRSFLDQQKKDRDPIEEAKEFGIDLTLLHSNLQKSPTERLQDHARFHEFVEELRRAGISKKS